MQNELQQLRATAVPRGVSSATTKLVARAKNATVIDSEGREYIDFAGGIGVMNVGHSHPRVLAAAHAQVDRFAHTCVHVFGYEAYIRLAAQAQREGPRCLTEAELLRQLGCRSGGERRQDLALRDRTFRHRGF